MTLKGYQGRVSKSATVYSNDPKTSQLTLKVEGTVIALIDIKPSPAVTFRGVADQIPETTLDMVGTSMPFHISGLESNLDRNIDYKLETVQEGKHYRLRIANKTKRGNYVGYIKFFTDLAQKPEVLVRVNGFMEGEVSIKPQTILIGKLSAGQPERTGKITVTSSRNKPFKITNLGYDEQLMKVTQHPLDTETGYGLEISPVLNSIPVGSRRQLRLSIETDLTPGEKDEVQVHLFNSADQPQTPNAPKQVGPGKP